MANDPVNNVDPDGGVAWFRPKPPSSYVRNFGKLTEIGKSFLEGFAEAVVSTVKGTVNTVLHPVETAKGIVHAVTNPRETLNSIKESAQDAWNTLKSGDPVRIAHMAGTLVGNLVTGGVEGKVMSTLGKVTKVTKFIAKAKTVIKEAAFAPILRTAKGLLKPTKIHFSQRTVSANVRQYVEDMKAGKWDWNKSGPIRVMEQDGQLVTYDNRRLMAAQQAELDNIPYERVNPNDIMPGSKKTWTQAFHERFNDPRNVNAGGAVPKGGLKSQPNIVQ